MVITHVITGDCKTVARFNPQIPEDLRRVLQKLR